MRFISFQSRRHSLDVYLRRRWTVDQKCQFLTTGYRTNSQDIYKWTDSAPCTLLSWVPILSVHKQVWFGLFYYTQNRTILAIANICNNIHILLKITLLQTSSLLTLEDIIPILVQMLRQYLWLYPSPGWSTFPSCATATDYFRTEIGLGWSYSPIRCSV